MKNTIDIQEENNWLGHICKTGELCPRAGYWKQVETGNIIWHEIKDKFSELEFTTHSYKRARYEYIGKTKK